MRKVTLWRSRAGATMVVMALLCGVLTACGATQSNTTIPGQTAIAAGALGGEFTSGSVSSAEDVLARGGIATVSNEKSTTPVVSVSGAVRLRFTVAQVRAMALQASDRGGILGSALDGAAPMPAGDVPLSYLLAAWVLKGTSPGARAIHTIMGSQDWTQAPSVLFPTIALPLFVADVADALPKAADATRNDAAQTVELASVVTAPCSLVSNFIQDTLATVFNALTLTAPAGAGVGSAIGSFFVSIWNEAVSLAQQAITGLVQAVTSAVVSAIASVSGAVAVIAEVASYLSPWSIKVTANPSSVAAGGAGSFSGVVDSGVGDADYPTSVQDCANKLNLKLPKLTAGGADATWALSGAITATGDTSVTLDKSGQTTVTYRASDSGSAQCSSGSGQASAGTAQLSVKRPAIDDLQTLVNSMITNGLGLAGSVVSPIVQSILEPLVSAILGKLDSLTQVTGSGSVAVAAPSSADCSPSPSTSVKPEAGSCLVGTWRLTDETLNGNSINGAGVIFVFHADGSGTENYAGSAPVQFTGNAIQYAGNRVIAISNIVETSSTAGTLTSTIVSGTVTATSADGHVETQPVGVSAPLSWTCQGNDSTLTANTGDLVTYHLARTS